MRDAATRERSAREERDLHAYFDGELAGLARWRFERRLRRDASLRRELAGLARVRQLVRAAEAPVPEPDLWDAIALRLPAADASRREAAERPRAGVLAPLLRPAGAVAAAALLVLAVAIGFWNGDTAPRSVVHWVDAGGRSVMLLEDDADMTVIWVLDGGSEGARRGGSRASV